MAAEHVVELVLPEAGALAAAPVVMHARVDLRLEGKARRDARGAGLRGEDLRLARVGGGEKDLVVIGRHRRHFASNVLRYFPKFRVEDTHFWRNADGIGRGGHARKRENGGRRGEPTGRRVIRPW